MLHAILKITILIWHSAAKPSKPSRAYFHVTKQVVQMSLRTTQLQPLVQLCEIASVQAGQTDGQTGISPSF